MLPISLQYLCPVLKASALALPGAFIGYLNPVWQIQFQISVFIISYQNSQTLFFIFEKKKLNFIADEKELKQVEMILDKLNGCQFLSHCCLRDYSTILFTRLFHLAHYETRAASYDRARMQLCRFFGNFVITFKYFVQ